MIVQNVTYQIPADNAGKDDIEGAPSLAAHDPASECAEQIKERSILTGTKTPRRWDAMSPLRYPGSKRKMLPAIQQLIEGNIPKPELFVEPFCGGASVALGLLEHDVVERVLLCDLDPLVAALWIEATTNAKRLIEDMMDEPVTVERWDFWRDATPVTTRELAMKCLFLNRTTFSGIIGSTAGPIGGRTQISKYKIDCRFPKDAIARRILNVKEFADTGRIVGVELATWQDTIRQAERLANVYPKEATVLYLDPPYIEKASRIYDLRFGEKDHRELARYLTEESTHRWLLSYDEEPLVIELYRGLSGVQEFGVAHNYTMRGAREKPVPGREILFTNLPNDPT